ncbi:MAG: mechanosensitive ion channel family protein [Acidobacteria bacterium]|nr:mechanosensitive ion channel family protein [Acidobacteriota bacterium]
MQAQPQLSESVFLAVRLVAMLSYLVLLYLVLRRALLVAVGRQHRHRVRARHTLAGCMLLAFVCLLLIRHGAEKWLTQLGNYLDPLVLLLPPGWFAASLIGLYRTLTAGCALVLMFQIVGAIHWFLESRLETWIAIVQQQEESLRRKSVRLQVLLAIQWANRAARTIVLAVLVVVYIVLDFRFFPRTAVVVDTFMAYLGTPASQVAMAFFNYLPNLGYLSVICAVGWLLLKLARKIFNWLGDGTLSIRGFQPDWAEPTYKLCRTLLLLFLLMISFPYLPGASSQFFSGFSLFVGALVTLGSTGAIGNVIAGIMLTYTSAFRVGDQVSIGGTIGSVVQKSLLVTHILTFQNEDCTVSNSVILSSSVINYSTQAASTGLILTVRAGIGYDVDWRTIHRLMIEAAHQTELILPDPAPCVWQISLDNYAVTYELRAFTNNAALRYETHSRLQANVLDAFNRAGVEIMTPSVLSHRDGSMLAVPREQYPGRARQHGIAVELDRNPE